MKLLRLAALAACLLAPMAALADSGGSLGGGGGGGGGGNATIIGPLGTLTAPSSAVSVACVYGCGGVGSVAITAPLGTNTIAASVSVTPATAALWTAAQGGAAITAANPLFDALSQSGAVVSSSNPIFAQITAGAAVIGAVTQSGAWNITNISGTIALPTGAATSANQTNASQKTQIVDGSGNVIASTSNNLDVQCANCSGSGVSTGDEASFTPGTSLFAGSGGFFQTVATNNALTNLQQGEFQVTANRALFTNLRNASGAEIGTSGSPLFTQITAGAAIIGSVTQSGTWTITPTGFNFAVVGTPFTATTGSATSAAFTSSTEVVVTNAGTTNTIYCIPGASTATTSDQPIAPNGGWFAFYASGGMTQISCATSTSTSTVNIAAGAGLPTGTGGGGGGTGGGGAITAPLGTNTIAASVSVTPATSSLWTIAQGGAALSATNGIFTNIVIAGAVDSATNGIYVNLLQGNTVISSGNPLFSQITNGIAGSSTGVSAGAGNVVSVQGATTATDVPVSVAGTTSDASSAVATSSTNVRVVAHDYGFNGTTWDQLQVDASKFLKVNCATGCSGGALSNASSAVATSSTNSGVDAWLYAFNGTTWDQLRDVSNASSAVATSAFSLGTVSYNYAFNGTTWDQLQVDANKSLITVLKQGASVLSATNGLFSNILQGNAVLSATNGIFSNTVIAGAVQSATNGQYFNQLQGNAVVSATNPSFVQATGNYFSNVVGSTLTRAPDTTTYTAFTTVCLAKTVTACAPMTAAVALTNAGKGLITQVTLLKSSATVTNASFIIHFFSAAPGVATPTQFDNTAYPGPRAGDLPAYLGYANCATPVLTSDTTQQVQYTCTLSNPNAAGTIPFQGLSGSTNIDMLLEVTAAYAPANGETFKVYLSGIY